MDSRIRREFEARVEKLHKKMDQDNLDLMLVYGNEYRREHLRYFSNFWPIFEMGMVAFSKGHQPVLLVGPENERYAKSASVWDDIRVIREMEMSYVPENVDFSLTNYAGLKDVMVELSGGKPKRIGVCGFDAMSVVTYQAIQEAADGSEVVNADSIVYDMRLIKSQYEVEMLTKAWEACDAGYKAVLDADIVGLTENQAAAIGAKAAQDAGAEDIVFSLLCSGEERTNTVIGRPSNKIIERGDMIMYALAVQYDGYIATNEWPYIAGAEPTPKQKHLIDTIVKAEDIGIQQIEAGSTAGEVVGSIKRFFDQQGYRENDVYPPIHGCGLAEAESPYPDEKAKYHFAPGMGINFDVSLFGVSGVGSNRIEEGFIQTEDGLLSLSPLISGLRKDYLRGK